MEAGKAVGDSGQGSVLKERKDGGEDLARTWWTLRSYRRYRAFSRGSICLLDAAKERATKMT